MSKPWIQRSFRIFFLFGLIILPLLFVGIKTYQLAESKPTLVYSAGDYFLWYEDSLTRVDKDTPVLPKVSNQPASVQIKAARNEYESFQIVFRSLNLSQYFYRQFQLVFSSLQPDETSDTPGNTTISAANFAWYKVDYVMDESDNGYADQLTPGSSFAIVLRQNHPFWIDLYVPMNAGAGDYIATVKVNLFQKPSQEFQIKLHVYNFSIPEKHSIVNTMGNSLIQAKIDMLQNRRISPYHIAKMSYQIDSNYTGIGFNFTFNWSEYDLLTTQAVSRNLDSFVVDFWDGWHTEFSAEFNQTMINWFRTVGLHLEEKGWLNLAYIYIIDEPSYEQLYRVKNTFDLVHEGHLGLRTMITTNPTEKSLPILEDCVDIWCPPVHEYNISIVRRLQDKGKIVWAYPCLFPKIPYFNFMIQNQPQDLRLYYWKTYYDGINGCLYWSTDWYHYNHGGYGYNGFGDGILIYELNRDRWAPSIRLQSIRDGIEDLEYFYIFESQFKAPSNSEYHAFQNSLSEFVDIYGKARLNRAEILDFRENIADKIQRV
jgi:hypothetical protein